MVFYFNTTSATSIGSTNTALGSIMLSTNYDLAEPNFESKQEVLSAYFSTSGLPSEDLVHAIECDPKSRPIDVLYVDHSGESAVDPAMYNLANFQVATAGMQAASVVGELWVSYDITFFKPKMSEVSRYTILENGPWSTDDPFGEVQTTQTGTPVAITATSGGYDTIHLGAYKGQRISVQVFHEGTGLANVAYNTLSQPGLTSFNGYSLGTRNWTTTLQSGSARAGATWIYDVAENVDDPYLHLQMTYTNSTTRDEVTLIISSFGKVASATFPY
jgi:hypothetical protein